ncbi:C-C chemokine receptor type 1-like [Lingula anatina]|uniref:C-C chemokine receptor type 1-like n=1 Tax=Lingula anatina TaxID=7574 RepID=A0A1S3J1D8_LINAN|nr:C-C chemokine receptor type 1-like [Lingula anatina]|eukprot:XP_013404262.1 C-C chemokine receptor type 1-like [Lingula anatina]
METNFTSVVSLCSCPGRPTNDSEECVEGLFERHSWLDILTRFDPVAVYADRVITPIWYIIGIFGNAVSFTIWQKRRMRMNNNSAYYLSALALSDLCFLLLHICMELKVAWGLRSLDQRYVCEIFMAAYYLPQYLSPMLVLGATLDRYVVVCLPFKGPLLCTKAKTIQKLFLALAFALLLCTAQAYLWQYDTQRKTCTLREETFLGRDLGTIWTWCSEMLIFFIVPLVILFINIRVIIAIWKVSLDGPVAVKKTGNNKHCVITRHESKGSTKITSTVMLLSVSFFVITLTFPATIVYAVHYAVPQGNKCLSDEEIRTDSTWQSYFTYITARKFVEEICLAHHACNFIIYYITGNKFRLAFRRLLQTAKSVLCSYKRVCAPGYAKPLALDVIRPHNTRNTKL